MTVKKDRRVLKTHVAFHRKDELGNVVESLTLAPDEDRPDWVHEQLASGDMEHLFVGGPEQLAKGHTDPGNGGQVEPPEGASPRGQRDPNAPATPGLLDSGTQPASSRNPVITGDAPPKGGPGSGREAWSAYAKQNGVEVREDASRDDIFEALEAAKIPLD